MKGAARLTRALLLGGICLFLVSQTVDAEVKPASPFATTQNAPAPPSAFAPPTAAPFQAPGPLGRLFAWIFDKQQSLQRSLATGVKSLKIDNPLEGASSPGFSISSKACNARSPRASSRSRSTILSMAPSPLPSSLLFMVCCMR
jgi:hypothetical protein